MTSDRVRQMARQFPENGMKLLLENPENVRDLLTLAAADMAKRIDLSRLKLLPTTFVQRDYRHVESDVVLTAPLRTRKGQPRRRVLIYILIEHQSQPDRLMPLRLLDYQVQIFKYQVRRWSERRRSLSRIGLEPVLPVVFYTGVKPWDSVGKLADLIEGAESFEQCTPTMEPLFVNLPKIKPKDLESKGGFFGWVLRLVQTRKGQRKEFQSLLKRAVEQLESMPGKERLRWLELLSYIVALVYHERSGSEQPGLRDTIESSVRTDPERQEILEMGKTYAEALKEEGALESRQQTLIRQLQKRFGELSADVVSAVNSTDDIEQLDQWLDRFATAKTLA